ncbi:MAG TPA: GIY-YIG nuclease family protein [Bacteroidia bacterium]|nr:GIY-YIG nuclease family protein [Bacteroidia bacterium]
MTTLFYTYILYSNTSKRFYIGQCKNIEKRLDFHNAGYVKSTKPYAPWTLIGSIQKPSRSEAMILEKKLKNFNRKDLDRFIAKYFS